MTRRTRFASLLIDAFWRFIHPLALGCIILFAVSAHAQEPQPEKGSTAPHAYVEPPMGEDCQENALRLSECLGQLRDHSQTYLDELVGYIASRLPQEQRDLLARAQSAWKEFRNAGCDFDTYLAAGNSAAALATRCQHTYNKDRIGLLSQYASCIADRGCGDDIRLYRFLCGQAMKPK